MRRNQYSFNYGWHFCLADAFPLQNAIDAVRDGEGRFFYERDYRENGWKEVSLPHTYNDADLFVDRIQDAGSGQKRTFSCYRKWFELEKDFDINENKVFLEIEGIRQTCYLYVNGVLAGYYEAGAFPIGFDITEFLTKDSKQLIAIATDSTSSRNMDVIGAETPNHPDARPGAFVAVLNGAAEVLESQKGVAYQWNCNDFNPTVGGLARNINLHIKPKTYLTLPLYSNLKTKGVYVYGSDFDTKAGQAVIHVEAEVRNESGCEREASLKVELFDGDGVPTAEFMGDVKHLASGSRCSAFRTIIPPHAYRRTEQGFEPVEEEAAGQVETDSYQVETLTAFATVSDMTFWDIDNPYLYRVRVTLFCDGEPMDVQEVETGFRKVTYQGGEGLKVNDVKVWLTGYAQRATNEWAALGCAPDWLRDMDAKLIRESNANHIRFMHVAGAPADIRAFDRFGIVCTQPAGDKERETFGRQWKQRVELMRDTIIYFRNHPSILFWEAGNNSINRDHMKEMRLLKEKLDPSGGRFMGCRTINTQEVIEQAEYAGTMLNRHAATFISGQIPITETEYLREEAPRRVWDDYTPPFYDYDNLWLGKGGRKQTGYDYYDLTSEELAIRAASGYQEFFHDRVGGASGRNLYSAAAALCWTDSAQHGRQSYSENGRMSGRGDPVRGKKQNFRVFQVMQSPVPDVAILGHWNYPAENGADGEAYRYALKEFNGTAWVKTGEYARRDPKDKTVYVVGSYGIAAVELYVNGILAGSCREPIHTFIFPIPHVDVTRQGVVSVKAYDYQGKLAAQDMIETAGDPAGLRLRAVTGEAGFWADGVDVAYLDVEVVDARGRICPLWDGKISFAVEGPVEFLGGYNSGRFRGPDRDDSVIHKDYVYAECGINRVFLRSMTQPGRITLTAFMEGSCGRQIREKAELETISSGTGALEETMSQRLRGYAKKGGIIREDAFPAILQSDKAKYIAREGVYCKVLVNGQEPNTNGVLSKVEHGSVYGPILYILESMHGRKPEAFSYHYENKILTLDSGTYHVEAEAGHTHMLVNGEENLLNGQPFVDGEGNFILEINAFITYIEGVRAGYDEKANLFRIEWQQ